jgi:protein SCO1/2
MKIYFGLFVLIIFSCQKMSNNNKDSEYTIELPYYNEPTFTPIWLDKSDPKIKNIHSIKTFDFQNQEGKWISQSNLKGKIYIANFFFTSCTTVCPKMATNLLKVQNEFSNNDKVKIMSHTVMPWVDNQKRLKEYGEINNIDSKFWHLLTGPKDEIYKIARESYFADEGFGKSVTTIDDFIHTENFFLIDSNNKIRAIYNGTLSLETSRMIEDIKSLL